MTVAAPSSRSLPLVVPWLAICLLALGIAQTTLQAQRNLSEVDQAVAALEKQVRTHEAAAAEMRRQPAPPEAWRALQGVGVVFVFAWAFVSVWRERTRRQEAVLNACVAMHAAVLKEKAL